MRKIKVQAEAILRVGDAEEAREQVREALHAIGAVAVRVEREDLGPVENVTLKPRGVSQVLG